MGSTPSSQITQRQITRYSNILLLHATYFSTFFLRERSILILFNILTNQKVLPGEVFDDRRFLKFRGRPWAQAAGEEEATELGASLAPTATGERVSDIDIE